MKRSLRSFWEGERLFIEAEVRDGERLVEKSTRVVTKDGGGATVCADAGKDDPIRGGYAEGEGRGSILWFTNGQIGVYGGGTLAAPPGWRLVGQCLPRGDHRGNIEDAQIEARHPDGIVCVIGDVVSAHGAVVLTLGHFTGTPGGSPLLTFEAPEKP